MDWLTSTQQARKRACFCSYIVGTFAQDFSAQHAEAAPIRDILLRMLGRMSFKIITAGTGREGLDLFQKHRPEISLVITDLNMPGLDGLTVLRSLRADAPELPILVMSGRIDEPVHVSLKHLGISGLIDKPFGYTQILEAVRGVLG